jgi:hypothetical protein
MLHAVKMPLDACMLMSVMSLVQRCVLRTTLFQGAHMTQW